MDDFEARLRERFQQPAIAVPPEVDARVLRAARRRLRPRRPWLVPLAAAAAAVILLLLWPRERSVAPRFDIVDAYQLAAKLRAGEPVASTWDVTGDGRVDEADVAGIARIAVSLGGES